MMDATNDASARANLARLMERVSDDHEPLIITRHGARAVVMMSLKDFRALEQTGYLLGSLTNAKRLLSAVETLRAD